MNFTVLPTDSLSGLSLADAGISPVDSLKHFPTDPGRGKACGKWSITKADGTTEPILFLETGIVTPMFDLSAFSSGNDFLPHPSYRCVAQDPGRVGGKNIPINDQTLDAIRYTFDAARRKGCQIIPRFAYAFDNYAGCEPDDMEWILTHIRQLSAVVNEFADCVIGLECGMLGPWGEMHSSRYFAPVYANRMLSAWLENLEPSICVLCRTPLYITNFIFGMSGNPEEKPSRNGAFPSYYAPNGNMPGPALLRELPLSESHPACRLGLYDDGYMGTIDNWGTYGPEVTRYDGVEFLKIQNEDKPYGGEFGHTHPDHLKSHGSPIYEDWFIKELYDTRLSYLRNLKHGVWPEVEPLKPFGKEPYGVQKELVRMVFDDRFAFDGMPDVSCYYGQTMHKFLIDHMGYRLLLREAKITPTAKKGGCVFFRGQVENVGFGNVLGKFCSELLIQAPDGKIQAMPCDVDPGTFQTCRTTGFEVAFAIPEAATPGTYRLFLRFATVPYGSGAPYAIPFANPEVYREDLTANSIGTFTVTE